jgi:Fe-S-cluster-containing dehydrogenase component/DMSO reductase anchor subunit
MKLDHSPLSGSILELDEQQPGIDDLVTEESPLPFGLDPRRQLSAAQAFSLLYERGAESFQGRYYSARMPVSLPGPGEQLAFEVDLDSCSGCKACVVACHALNGLDNDEAWRSVGLLQGGTSALPVLQHITSSCHHCLDPACLHGCPVNAYEKDPATGIVKHLDDQCIGCQYCILKCPYDAPKYNKNLGIVRKCDMCSERLTSGESPACAQACPTQAIRISVISARDVIEQCEANRFLPGAPEPAYTLPTTIYRTSKTLPRNVLPADHYAVKPAHAHAALVVMLILTQMSVGAFVADMALSAIDDQEALRGIRLFRVTVALLVGLLGLSAAVGHLGRPLYAFRALIGLRTSWLSREILAFGLFAAFATVHGADVWLREESLPPKALQGISRLLAALFGLIGVFCSVMIYVDTRRAFWSFPLTGFKFFMSAVLLGIPVSLLVWRLGEAWTGSIATGATVTTYARVFLLVLMAASQAKLAIEGLVLQHLRDKKQTSLKGTAILLTGELRRVALVRVILGAIGGIIMPGLMLTAATAVSPNDYPPFASALSLVLVLLFTLSGELLERYLFFTASVAPKMPGGLAS